MATNNEWKCSKWTNDVQQIQQKTWYGTIEIKEDLDKGYGENSNLQNCR